MAQLMIDDNIKVYAQDSHDEIFTMTDDVNNYKGMYQDEDEESEQKYFENGAHFQFHNLCLKLEEIARSRSPESVSDSLSQSFQGIFIFIKDHKRTAEIVGNSVSKNNQNNISSNCGINNNKNMNRTLDLPLFNCMKPQSFQLENNYIIALNSNLTNNKSRNAIQTDNVYKQVTAVPSQIMNNININYAHNNLNHNNTNNNCISGGINLGVAVNHNENKSETEFSKLKDDNSIDNDNTTGLFNQNINVGNLILEDKKLQEKENVNLYSSYSNEIINFNQNNKMQNSMKKNFPSTSTSTSNNPLFKKCSPIILVDKIVNSSNTGVINKNKINLIQQHQHNHPEHNRTSFMNDNNNSKQFEKQNYLTNSMNLSRNKVLTSSNPMISNANKFTLNNINSTNYSITNVGSNVCININSVINTYNSKLGRNSQILLGQLNPHNTSNSKAKLKSISNSKKEIKKLNLENLKKINANNKYISTSSVDYRDNRGNSNKDNLIKTNSKINTPGINTNTSKIVYSKSNTNKTIKSSNTKSKEVKNLIHTINTINTMNTINTINISNTININNISSISNINGEHEKEKEIMVNRSPTKLTSTNRIEKETNTTNKEVALNDIISHLGKNVETKSRNATRNNLTSTKSNILNSDKAQSMQSGSYNKSCILGTQGKTTVNNNKSKPKIGYTCTKTTASAFANTNILTTASGSGAGAGPGARPASGLSTKPASLINKSIEKSTNFNNFNNLNKLCKEKDKGTVAGTVVGAGVDANAKNISIPTNISQKPNRINHVLNKPEKKVIDAYQRNHNKLANYNFIKIDLGKEKPKSNSLNSASTSNVSNLNKNHYSLAVRASNSTYLNLKKNDFSVVRNFTNTSSNKSSKALINTLSTSSLEKNF